MKAVEVWINGEKKCVAGVADEALLSCGLTWAQVGGHLHVGGLENGEHLRWLEPSELDLKVGDEVMFRLVETDAVDEPIERRFSRTRAEKEAEVRAHLSAARALVAFVDEAEFAIYEQHLAQGHLIGATDTLGALGERVAVPAEFWRELSNACHALTQYEDRKRYWKKFEQAEHSDEKS